MSFQEESEASLANEIEPLLDILEEPEYELKANRTVNSKFPSPLFPKDTTAKQQHADWSPRLIIRDQCNSDNGYAKDFDGLRSFNKVLRMFHQRLVDGISLGGEILLQNAVPV